MHYSLYLNPLSQVDGFFFNTIVKLYYDLLAMKNILSIISLFLDSFVEIFLIPRHLWKYITKFIINNQCAMKLP